MEKHLFLAVLSTFNNLTHVKCLELYQMLRTNNVLVTIIHICVCECVSLLCLSICLFGSVFSVSLDLYLFLSQIKVLSSLRRVSRAQGDHLRNKAGQVSQRM